MKKAEASAKKVTLSFGARTKMASIAMSGCGKNNDNSCGISNKNG